MSLPEEVSSVDQSTNDFMLKVLSKCASYRRETANEKLKREEMKSEIVREFGNSSSVQAVITEFEKRV